MSVYYKSMTHEQLKHHGIKGMHWGIRRFQNEDGTLTAAGKKRYESSEQLERAIKKKPSDDYLKFQALNNRKKKQSQQRRTETTQRAAKTGARK